MGPGQGAPSDSDVLLPIQDPSSGGLLRPLGGVIAHAWQGSCLCGDRATGRAGPSWGAAED